MASDSYIIKNLEKANISRADMIKNGFSGQKYDDVLRGKSSYKIPEIILISEKFQLSLDFLVFGKENNNEFKQNETELLEIFRKFDNREQLKIIGRMEEWLEIKRHREVREEIVQEQRIVGVQVARRTDGKFVKEPVTAEEMEKIKALPEDTDY